MRCLRTIGLVALLIGASTLPQEAVAGPRVIERREAEASWTLPDKTGKHDYIQYWVWVRRMTATGGSTWTRVRLTAYKCDNASRNSTYCSPFHSVEKEIPNDAFEIDDQLASASVTFHAFGQPQRARWRAIDRARRSGMGGYCRDDRPIPEMYEGIYRAAKSSGRLFGDRVTPTMTTRWDYADIIFMVGAQHCGTP